MNALKKILAALNSHITDARSAVVWLTVARAALLIAATISTIAVFTLWEQRSAVFRAVTSASIDLSPQEMRLNITPDIQEQIKKVVDRHPVIGSITVYDSDLRFNRRDIVYRYSDDPMVTASWAQAARERGLSFPVFNTSDSNNAQMVSVVNGEFSCSKYEETLSYALTPDLAKALPTLCRISLPPYYGQFMGYLNVGLIRQVDPAEMSEIRLEITRLASDIFYRLAKR